MVGDGGSVYLVADENFKYSLTTRFDVFIAPERGKNGARAELYWSWWVILNFMYR